MKRLLSFLTILILILLCWSASLQAAAWTRYVKNGGDNDKDGTSDANAWETVGKVETFLAGLGSSDTTTVYFKRGDTWTITGVFNVGGSGTVTIGAYGAGDLPIIDGNWYCNGQQPGTPNDADDRWNHAIEIGSSVADYTIQDLEIKRVWGTGIQAGDGPDGGIIRRCYIHDIGRAGINFGATQDHLVEYCELATIEEFYRQYSQYLSAGNWAQAINMSGTGHKNWTIQHNYIHDTWGEGVGAGNNIVRYNVFSNCRTVHIYCDPWNTSAANTNIYCNLVFGTPDATYATTSYHGRDWCGDGIAVRDEASGGTNSGTIDIWGNIVIGCRSGIKLVGSSYSAMEDVNIYNNMFLDNAYNIIAAGNDFTDIDIINNLSINNYDTHVNHVTDWDDAGPYDVGPNWWYGGELEDSDFVHVSDLDVETPALPTPHPMGDGKGWTTLTDITDFTFSDLYCTNVDQANAVDLGSSYYELLTTGTVFPTQYSDLVDDTAIWTRTRQDEQGEYKDFGAIIYSLSNTAPNCVIDTPATSPYVGDGELCNESITFECTCTDADGDSVTVEWNFDDGNTSSDEDTTHAFTGDGSYTVSVTGTDEHGLSDSSPDSRVVIVDDCGGGGPFDTWGQRVPIVIPKEKVAGPVSNLPVCLNEESFPQGANEIFDADGTNPALNGGGDLRFTTDTAGNNRLSCDVVTFVTDNDPSNGVAEVWVKIPSLSSASNTTIYCWYNKAGQSQPAADAAYGSESVWSSSFKGVWHLDEAGDAIRVDSTQYDEDLTESTGDTIAEVACKIGNCGDFERDDTEYLYITDGTDLDINGANQQLSILCWLWHEQAPQSPGGYFISKYNTTGDQRQYAGYSSDDGLEFFKSTSSASGASFDEAKISALSQGTWTHIGLTYDDVNMTIYKDGDVPDSGDNPQADTQGIYNGTAQFRIGSRGDNSLYWDGKIDEVWVLNTAVSAAFVETAYNNQNDPGTFAVDGDPVAPNPPTTPIVVNIACTGEDCTDKTYVDSDTIGPFTITMSENCDLDVTDADNTLQITFELGDNDIVSKYDHTGGDLSDTATIEIPAITVLTASSHMTEDLDIASAVSIALIGTATLESHDDSTAADLTVSPTGAEQGSLASNHDIVVNTTTTTVVEVIGYDPIKCPACSPDDSYSSGEVTVGIVYQNGPVTVLGVPDFGRVEIAEDYPSGTYYMAYNGSYTAWGGPGDGTLKFTINLDDYAGTGLRQDDLAYTATDAFTLNNGTFMGPNGAMTRTLPTPGEANSLSYNAAIALIVANAEATPCVFGTDDGDEFTSLTAALTGGWYALPDDFIEWDEDVTETGFDTNGSGTSGHVVNWEGNNNTITVENAMIIDEDYQTFRNMTINAWYK